MRTFRHWLRKIRRKRSFSYMTTNNRRHKRAIAATHFVWTVTKTRLLHSSLKTKNKRSLCMVMVSRLRLKMRNSPRRKTRKRTKQKRNSKVWLMTTATTTQSSPSMQLT